MSLFASLGSGDITVAGKHPRFYCIDCNEQVDEIATMSTSFEAFRSLDVLLTCHQRTMTASLPVEFFTRISYLWNISWMNFVVGFHGDWSVKLRNYDWFLTQPQTFWAACGHFRFDQLRRLFTPTEHAINVSNVEQYGLDSAFFDLINTPKDIRFPAQFWFRTLGR
jgi:hypothetical protein